MFNVLIYFLAFVLETFSKREAWMDSRLNPSSLKDKKKNTLYSNKSSLIALLNKIKNCQLNYISEKTHNKKYNIINTKAILSLLKDNLSTMLKDKNKIYNYFKKENDKKKKKIQKLLFPDEGEDIDTEEEGGYKLTIGNKKLYSSEINQLKILNFQIENEINYTQFLTNRNYETIINIKDNPFYLSDENEIICTPNYNNISKTSNILHDYINKQRKKFIDTVSKKSEQDIELKALSMKNDYLKNIIVENNKKIITEDIINECEESKDYAKEKDTENSNYKDYMKRKSLSSKNNKNNLLKFMSNEKINKNIFFVNKEKNIRKKLIFSETVSPKIIYKMYSNKNNLIKNVNNNVNNNVIEDDEGNENILKSFNSSRDLETSIYQNNENNDNNNNKNEINIKTNEDNKIICVNNITNENSNTENSNNKSNKKDNNQNSFGLELNEKGKQNEDAEYIFTLSNKE